MKRKLQLVPFLAVPLLFGVFLVCANGSTENCTPCEDIQHAADLSAIEKRLLPNHLESIEEMDEEAREWFGKFQEGGLLFDGWKEISDEVVKRVPDDQKIKTKVTMLALGVRIGCEWSKENDVRKISTDMLKKWGKQLRKTVADSPVKIPTVINSIEAEVDSLLL
ncbi:MAG: hypothetical protein K9K37_06180 [Desulfocapsa sp.]|nr:hypothetical protein [Desulfocapsa sp.]